VRFLCWLFGHKIRPMPTYLSLYSCTFHMNEKGLNLTSPVETECLRCEKRLTV